MKRWFLLASLPCLLAAAPPVPLVTGAIRDQFGDPISNASVQAGAAAATTDAAGTFAVDSAARFVVITCAFCKTTVASVAADQTVTAIVQRYQAPAQEQISRTDIGALPYAHSESALSLNPFVVLNDSKRLLPGPYVSFYGLSRFGGLMVLNGVPTYDVAAGASPLRGVPAYDAAAASVRGPWDGVRYGNLAPGGSFFVDTTAPQTLVASAVNGTQRAVNVSDALGATGFNTALSGDDDESRARADASYWLSGGDNALFAGVGVSHDSTGLSPVLNESSSNARINYDRTSSVHTYANITADDSRYTSWARDGAAVNGRWSQVLADAGVATQQKIATFFDAGAQVATGYYDASPLGGADLAGTNLQAYLSAGAQSQSNRFFWRAAINALDARYNGGSNGTSTPLGARILSPSASVGYEVGPGVDLSLDAGRFFRLPTLLETYGYGADETSLHVDNYAAVDAKLTITDQRRLRVSLLGVRANVSDLDTGVFSAAGLAFAWQIAPAISLRAWSLHFDDASKPYAPVFRYGAAPQPATPASVWAEYENGGGLRLDAIWRRDLFDYQIRTHTDLSISGPLSRGFRWFIGSERRSDEQYVSAGVRLARP